LGKRKIDRKKYSVVGAGVVIVSLMLLHSPISIAAQSEAPVEMMYLTGYTGGYDVDNESVEKVFESILKNVDKFTKNGKIIWVNKKATGIYELAYLTTEEGGISGEFIEEPLVKTLEGKTIGYPKPNGVFIRWYIIEGRNAWGWVLFKLVAKGIFLFSGPRPVFVYPMSYAIVSWWCQWAWSVDSMEQYPTVGDNWGRVDAQATFKYFLGGTVCLSAYIQCYYDGTVDGDGGEC